jgi:ferredoxin
MAKITATTATGEVVIDAKNGRKLVLELEDNGVDILHRCGGNAKCTTCGIEVIAGDAGEMREAEKAVLTAKGIDAPNFRLSCQIHCENDLSIKVLKQASTAGIDAGTRPTDE